MSTFVIEDESHAEWCGEFDSFDAALSELKSRSQIPWDASPNCCPCQSWKTCSRNYEILEYDNSQKPWKELSRLPIMEISAKGVVWNQEFEPEETHINASKRTEGTRSAWLGRWPTMTLNLYQSDAQFEQPKNPMAEIREALPSSSQPNMLGLSEEIEGLGENKALQSDSVSYRRVPNKRNLVKIGLRMFSWVFIGTGIPYYGYFLWKGEYYLPRNGEEKIAAVILLIAMLLMMIGSQRKKIKIEANKTRHWTSVRVDVGRE